MAGEKKIAASYAGAYFNLAVEKNIAENAYQDMQLVLKVLEENHDLCKVFASPIISVPKKNNIVEAVFGSSVHELTKRFLTLMVKSARIVFLDEIANQAIALYKDYKGIKTVNVKTAVPLSERQREALSDKMAELLGSKIELLELIDPKLIGGMVVQVGDKRFDASFRTKLNKLDRQFDINIYKKGF